MKVDLSPTSSLTFQEELAEADALLKARKSVWIELDFGQDPFFQNMESFRIAVRQLKEMVLEPLRSVIKGIKLFSLTPDFFTSSLNDKEMIEFKEGGFSRIDLFRRDLLSEFLSVLIPILGEEFPLELQVSGPLHWLHPAKFPWIVRKRNLSPLGLLLPSIETDETISAFQALLKEHADFRLLTEETLPLEWEALEELWFVEEGVTRLGRRALLGFEAAGGSLMPV